MSAGRIPFGAARWGPLLGGLVGIGLSIWLLRSYGVRRILELVSDAGWVGIACVVAFHGIQMFFSAFAWRVIAKPVPPCGSVREYFVLRWIREAVNNLLPLAQVGGEVVASRLLGRSGTKLPIAIAGTLADLTIEMVTQIIFTLAGVALLLLTGYASGVVRPVIAGVLVAMLLMTGLFAALRSGFGQLLEDGLVRLGQLLRWRGAAHVQGLSEALSACYREPSRVARSGLWHMLSWLSGAVEVCLVLHFLGHDVDAKAGLVIESLGQAAKALGFAVPGSLGIQEGGYVAVCAVFGLAPDVAIALSLIKRLREAILGIPALFVWQHWEARLRASPRLLVTETVP